MVLCFRFMMAAVSSAVVIPSMIIFQKKGLGTNKGIPSFIMAASGIDDVMAICKLMAYYIGTMHYALFGRGLSLMFL